ncbi:MAG: molybdenum cofactor biosynthesis protein MoaE [Pseudomonadota bacterium]
MSAAAEALLVVKVQEQDFDLAAELRPLSAGRAQVGAVANFVGLVRGRDSADASREIAAMELEHYPGMTERSLRRIAEEAAARWPLSGVVIIHRYGPLRVGDQIVLAAASSAHRGAALEACAFLMDYLKTDAPFWKREIAPDGSGAWVDARDEDDAAKARWR